MLSNKVNYNEIHVRSMKWFYEKGMERIPEHVAEVKIYKNETDFFILKIMRLFFTNRIQETPEECLITGNSYIKTLRGKFQLKHSNGEKEELTVTFGDIPVMDYNEQTKQGGGFIVNGNEKICRLLFSLKRNKPVLQGLRKRKSGEGLMDKCLLIKTHNGYISRFNRFCMKKNKEIVFFFFSFQLNIITLLYCLQPTNDREVLMQTNPMNFTQLFVMKTTLQLNKFKTQKRCLEVFGKLLKTNFEDEFYQEDRVEIAKKFINKYVLTHLPTFREKYQYLIYIIQKFLRYYTGEEKKNDVDTWQFQEVQHPATVFMEVFRTELDQNLRTIKSTVEIARKRKRGKSGKLKLDDIIRSRSSTFGRNISRFLATGEVPQYRLFPTTLSQLDGIFIMVEKTNFLRFESTFRAIHRGRQFVDTKSLEVRKFKNENWGFLCPVNTPDGIQCGLLNHLSSTCRVTYRTYETTKIRNFLPSLKPFLDVELYKRPAGYSFVLMNGSICGFCPAQAVPEMMESLRAAKRKDLIPKKAEVFSLPPYQELEINTTDSRLIRPVLHKESGIIEWISPSEQLILHVSLPKSKENRKKDMEDEGEDEDEEEEEEEEKKKNEEDSKIFTHEEISRTAFLSFAASLTPFSNFNQSPRNVYQCQMAKQTVSIPPRLNFTENCENKTYVLDYVQRGLSNTKTERELFEELHMGLNCVVAILSYTSHDMEDAMIINKSSYERGLFSAKIYESEKLDLRETSFILTNLKRDVEGNVVEPFELYSKGIIGENGVPEVGARIREGDVYVVMYETENRKFKPVRWRKSETVFVENVTFFSEKKCILKLRKVRNPSIGDKFSSRHGQKGILSFLWPEEDMPFAESGMRPDILINPHAFPSRMTIGMMVEMLSSKEAALNYKQFNDATSFKYNNERPFMQKFGEKLVEHGYNYYGNENLYSGTQGTMLEADIFMGVCFYQRLRHMVKDKYQVRISGIRSSKTHQPLKGRKRGGGIRFGEMERDCLLSYGASHLLKDRLFHSSDESFALLCVNCGNILSSDLKNGCLKCGENTDMKVVEIPYVLKYLVNELAMMNIKMKMDVCERNKV